MFWLIFRDSSHALCKKGWAVSYLEQSHSDIFISGIAQKKLWKGSECCQIKNFVILPRVNQKSICRQRLRDGKTGEEEVPGCSKAVKQEISGDSREKEFFVNFMFRKSIKTRDWKTSTTFLIAYCNLPLIFIFIPQNFHFLQNHSAPRAPNPIMLQKTLHLLVGFQAFMPP